MKILFEPYGSFFNFKDLKTLFYSFVTGKKFFFHESINIEIINFDS
jgi:hypothetical protein